MKKFFIDMIDKDIYYALFAGLAFGSVTSQSNILNIAAAAFWVVILLGCVIGVFTTSLAYAVEKVTDEKSRQSALESLRKIVRRKNVIARWWGWLCTVAIIALLAYSGWVFTAVCYALSSLFVRLCISLARDKVEKQTAEVLA
ncbi:hypothetical protein ACVCDR_005414 [Klebsiella pneumoniae]|uniref:hypothetical protein n=1 Tax=Klebsiella pneumoniae TaxID=573 RepID=UPI0020265F57|nr:hypothetical protein [Klebsiella pneumoniae]HBV3922603.1 hypothetical protein [Klebsiella quasipneumoniae]HDS3994059.1 hypothetical protein [Klebsiella pneumoniae subsp. pneumoniae]URL43134.1 hypothetical protein J0G27_08830 [Klebsiella pneumoniae]HBR5226792.1 hypothetical protein [Klebsiella pneumoniae]HDY8789156.1 hypothetical protein [Klebsiella pneumoniae]